MLILAGVSIATLTGENGILTRAQDAKKQTEIASVKEQAQLDITNWVAEELKNGIDGTISSWEDIKNILNKIYIHPSCYFVLLLSIFFKLFMLYISFT